MDESERTLVFFDLEAAGPNPKRHPIVQVAAIAIDANLCPVETFEAKILFDERQANRNSLRKNHYRRGIWARKGLEPEAAARSFAEFLRRHASVAMLGSDGEPYHLAQLVAHNAQFDAEFLQTWYERLYMYLPARYQVFCTMQRALWYFQEHLDESRPTDFKLATLCKHFGVPFHAANAHDALGDVTATVALYRAISKRLERPGSVYMHPIQASVDEAEHRRGSAGSEPPRRHSNLSGSPTPLQER